MTQEELIKTVTIITELVKKNIDNGSSVDKAIDQAYTRINSEFPKLVDALLERLDDINDNLVNIESAVNPR